MIVVVVDVSASDRCALQEALYKCIDTIQYNSLRELIACTGSLVTLLHINRVSRVFGLFIHSFIHSFITDIYILWYGYLVHLNKSMAIRNETYQWSKVYIYGVK